MESRIGDTILQDTSDGRGRGLFLTTGKQAGDILVNELSSAIWLNKSCYNTDCAFCCLHVSDDSKPFNISCDVCKRVSYCSISCQEYDRSQHEFTCPFLAKSLELNLDEDADLCVNLCVTVAYLMRNKPGEFQKIMSQDGGSSELSPEETEACESAFRLFQSCGADTFITKELIFDLYKKDKACGFAIMKPPHLRLQESEQDVDERESDNRKVSGDNNTIDVKKGNATDDDEDEEEKDDGEWEDLDTESVVKGFAIYPYLSLINHSCLPNCIRWDVVDAPADSDITAVQRRGMHFRALNALPPGAELLHSYVPICWSLDERQEYLLDMFGFSCQCDRCITETVIEGKHGKKSTALMNLPSADKKAYKHQYAYIQLYLEKHTCGENGCSGALTPVVGFNESVPGSDIYECNVCLRKRSHGDFVNAVNELRRS